MEGTGFFTMAALNAGRSLDGQSSVMVCGHLVAGQGQVVIFVDSANIHSNGARQAMVAIDAYALRQLIGKAADDGIILLGGSRL